MAARTSVRVLVIDDERVAQGKRRAGARLGILDLVARSIGR